MPVRHRQSHRDLNRERVLAEWRGYWEPEDDAKWTREASAVVSSAMKDLGLKQRFDEEQIFEAWVQLVDPFTAQHSRPVSLERKVLFIQVLHSTVFYELERMKGAILAKMQEQFGVAHIREVRFRLG
ncbi:MAG: DUF721 domain-containing protein [Verrucomicrobiota bacterium]